VGLSQWCAVFAACRRFPRHPRAIVVTGMLGSKVQRTSAGATREVSAVSCITNACSVLPVQAEEAVSNTRSRGQGTTVKLLSQAARVPRITFSTELQPRYALLCLQTVPTLVTPHWRPEADLPEAGTHCIAPAARYSCCLIPQDFLQPLYQGSHL
jgi:hypothetical protein